MLIENICSPASGEPVKNQFALITDKYKIMQSYSTPIMKISRHLNKAGDFMIYVSGDPYDYSVTTSKYVNQFLRDYTCMNPDIFKKAVKAHAHEYTERLTHYKIRYMNEISL